LQIRLRCSGPRDGQRDPPRLRERGEERRELALDGQHDAAGALARERDEAQKLQRIAEPLFRFYEQRAIGNRLALPARQGSGARAGRCGDREPRFVSGQSAGEIAERQQRERAVQLRRGEIRAKAQRLVERT